MSNNNESESISTECEETIEEATDSWQELKANPDYEINADFPYQIRKKANGRIIKEWVNKSNGYVYCRLNEKCHRKHRLVAEQWLPNPDNLPQIDHTNRDRTDFHLDNLRWITGSDNCKNKSVANNVTYEYVDKIDEDAIEITDYGNHRFEFYYYVEKDDSFYFYTGVQYRKLHINIEKKSGLAFVCAFDVNNKRRRIYLNKFKRLYDIEF